MIRTRSTGAVLALMLAIAWHGTASAAGVVGDGTLASCSEAALDAALADGGGVSFACGGPATIIVTATKRIAADTRIDGSRRITLSGGGLVQVLRVEPGAHLDVIDLTIADGNADLEPGGGIRNLGSLRLERTTLRDNLSRGFGGGLANEGECEVSATLFSDNRSGIAGGGIANFRQLSVRQSTLMRNVASGELNGVDPRLDGSGGGIANFGTLRLSNSTLAANVAVGNLPNPAFGGGLLSTGSAEIRNCTFARNRTLSPSPFGGYSDDGACPEVDNLGVLSVRNSILPACCSELTGSVADSVSNLSETPYSYNDCGPGFLAVRPEILRLGGLRYQDDALLPTVAVGAGSAAIGAGDVATCTEPDGTAAVDQLGSARLGAADPTCDIGAVEAPYSTEPPPALLPTFIRLRGERGSYVADGRDVLVTPADGRFWNTFTDFALIRFFSDPQGSFWTVILAPPLGTELAPGFYEAPNTSPEEPYVDVSGDGSGCLSGSGRFAVHEVAVALDGFIERLAVDLEWHCERRPARVVGSVRINSDVPSSLCRADCNVTGAVDVADVILGVSLAQGSAPRSACPFFDQDENGRVAIGDLLAAVNELLSGCDGPAR